MFQSKFLTGSFTRVATLTVLLTTLSTHPLQAEVPTIQISHTVETIDKQAGDNSQGGPSSTTEFHSFGIHGIFSGVSIGLGPQVRDFVDTQDNDGAQCEELQDSAKAKAEQVARDTAENRITRYARENGYTIMGDIETSINSYVVFRGRCWRRWHRPMGTWQGALGVTVTAIFEKVIELD